MNQSLGIGIDLGGTFIKYALGTIEGKILAENKIPTFADAEKSKILDQIAEAVSEMVSFAGTKGLIPKVIGIGTPGNVDTSKGYLAGSTPNFRYWKEVHISKEMENRVNIPTFVDNDANLMALAEARFGAGVGHENIICLTIGTGIGGGIILNGNLYRGSRYAGAELGHVTIRHDGPECRCGGKGCLERYASASAMIDYFHKKMLNAGIQSNKDTINVKYIFQQFKEGSPQARETIEKSTYYLGRGIADFLNIFNPTLVIIGGGVAESGSLYLKMVADTTYRYAMKNTKECVKIVRAKLGNNAGYIGALSFAFDQLRGVGHIL